MRSLEEIADNPSKATITENLVLVADPYGDFAKKHGPLPPDEINDIIKVLRDKFVEGEGLVSRFRSDLVGLESQRTQMVPHSIETVYQKLQLVLDTRPDLFVQQLQRLWRSRESINSGKIRLTGTDKDVFGVVKYTHDWRHYVEKGYDPEHFAFLKRIKDQGIILRLRENPNIGYPHYVLYGWQEKIKVMERIVKKLLYKIFKAMESAGSNKDAFYNDSFGTDYFGYKVVGTSRLVERVLAGVIYDKNSVWIPRKEDPEDYRKSKAKDVSKAKKGKNLRAIEYLLRHKHDQTTERLQVQINTLTDYLLDEFFDKDSHPLFRVRRDIKLAEYEKRHRRLYDRMEKSMSEVLSFLPR